MIKKSDLTGYFFKGIKSKDNLKIGVEHEKFILNKNTLKPVSYEEHNGIKNTVYHPQIATMTGNFKQNRRKFPRSRYQCHHA